MIISHSKVSGLANPADMTKVGGQDWDDPHVITGPRVLGAFDGWYESPGPFDSREHGGTSTRTGVGEWEFALDENANYLRVMAQCFVGMRYTSCPPACRFSVYALDVSGVTTVFIQVYDSSGSPIDPKTVSVVVYYLGDPP